MNYYHSKEWLSFLEKSMTDLLAMQPVPYSTITPSQIPGKAGVYLLFEVLRKREFALYVGRTKNLRNRIYTNHLMGSISNARLKKYIIQDANHSCFDDVVLAKDYIRKNCFIKWILEDDIRKRGALEGYFTARLFPKYGIAEEH
jgi:hypothetical protein